MSDMDNAERQAYLDVKRVTSQLLLEEVGTVRQALGQIRSVVEDATGVLHEGLEKLAGAEQDAAREMISRAIQVDDLVSQLAAYCDVELDNLEHLAGDINGLVNSLLDLPPIQRVYRVNKFGVDLNTQLGRLRIRLADKGHRSVLQASVSEGDVDFF